MDKWERFIASLATPGGTVVILALLSVPLTAVTVFMAYHSDRFGTPAVVGFQSLLASFAGALFGNLTRGK
jgi:hypothetical protein